MLDSGLHNLQLHPDQGSEAAVAQSKVQQRSTAKHVMQQRSRIAGSHGDCSTYAARILRNYHDLDSPMFMNLLPNKIHPGILLLYLSGRSPRSDRSPRRGLGPRRLPPPLDRVDCNHRGRSSVAPVADDVVRSSRSPVALHGYSPLRSIAWSPYLPVYFRFSVGYCTVLAKKDRRRYYGHC